MLVHWHVSLVMVYGTIDSLARGSGSGLCFDPIKSLPSQIYDVAMVNISGNGLLPDATQVTLGQSFCVSSPKSFGIHPRAVSQQTLCISITKYHVLIVECTPPRTSSCTKLRQMFVNLTANPHASVHWLSKRTYDLISTDVYSECRLLYNNSKT